MYIYIYIVRTYMNICIYICLSIHLSIHLSIYLSIYHDPYRPPTRPSATAEDKKNCNRCGLAKPLDLDVAPDAAGGGYGAALAPVQRASPYGFNGDLVMGHGV